MNKYVKVDLRETIKHRNPNSMDWILYPEQKVSNDSELYAILHSGEQIVNIYPADFIEADKIIVKDNRLTSQILENKIKYRENDIIEISGMKFVFVTLNISSDRHIGKYYPLTNSF